MGDLKVSCRARSAQTAFGLGCYARPAQSEASYARGQVPLRFASGMIKTGANGDLKVSCRARSGDRHDQSDGENTIPPYDARPARTDARAARTGVKQERREQGNNVARIELCGRILYNPFPSLKHKNFRQFRKLILPYLIIALLPNYVATCL
jgi:hypothetical protein